LNNRMGRAMCKTWRGKKKTQNEIGGRRLQSFHVTTGSKGNDFRETFGSEEKKRMSGGLRRIEKKKQRRRGRRDEKHKSAVFKVAIRKSTKQS